MIRWVFLDVGNVLLDEDPLTYLSFRRHVEAVGRVVGDRTFSSLLAEREERALAGSRWPVFEVVSEVLDDTACSELWNQTEREIRARYAELSPLITGADALVEALARRYRLGLIANQGPECRTALDTLGLIDRFEVIAFSEEQGIFKPDRGLFERAIRESGADPADCLMVGDRLDNDLAPASELGMATAWIRWPRRTAKGWRPCDPEALAYRDSLERCSARSALLHSYVRPTRTVDEIRELTAAITTLGP